jgi:predicted glycoside hydrolase/deacetylase ChbG (UPF0249 family)
LTPEPDCQPGELAATSCIVVCGDDFGMAEGIDDGLIALGRVQRLSAIGCMTLGPTFAQRAPALSGLNLDLGVHLNFTEPLGRTDGLYMSLPGLIASSYARTLNAVRVRGQIERQLDAFELALGRTPDFVDGHQHVHQLPQIRTQLIDVLARRYGGHLPWLRCTTPAALNGIPVGQRMKAAVIGALGAAALTRLASRSGLRTNRRLLGVYDFQGGEGAYAALLPHWLGCARDGDVLMCHPAMSANVHDGIGEQRVAEFRVLEGASVQSWLVQHGLRIGRL